MVLYSSSTDGSDTAGPGGTLGIRSEVVEYQTEIDTLFRVKKRMVISITVNY